MELSKKYSKACPNDLLNITFILEYFGKCIIKGANDEGIMVFSENNDLFTFKESDIREYIKDPNKINNLIKH